eukprot:5545889-Pleurochrysis_carterae.AAC.1
MPRGEWLVPTAVRTLSCGLSQACRLGMATSRWTFAAHDASTAPGAVAFPPVSYTHLRAHETDSYL